MIVQLHFTAGHSCIRNNIINVPAHTLAEFFFSPLSCQHIESTKTDFSWVCNRKSCVKRGAWFFIRGLMAELLHHTLPFKKTPLSTAVQEVCTFVCKSCPQTPPHTPNRPLKETLPCPYRPLTETPLHPPYRLPTETPLTLPIDCPQKHCLAHPIDRPKKHHFTSPHRLLTETQSTEEQNKVFLLLPPPPPQRWQNNLLPLTCPPKSGRMISQSTAVTKRKNVQHHSSKTTTPYSSNAYLEEKHGVEMLGLHLPPLTHGLKWMNKGPVQLPSTLCSNTQHHTHAQVC